MYRKLRNDELERLSAEEFKRAHKLKITVILDNVRSQHNIGSVFRTADSFFIEKIILCGICAVPPTPEIHKSALGAEFSVDWQYYKNTSEAVAALKEEGYIIISVEQAENSIMLHNFEPDPDKKYALVFGNEVKGVSQDVVDMSDSVLEIPQFGTKHSLNISVSAGAVLWECCKKLKLV
ncbi:MAG: RNA methyltransferase [Bacteroidales bacterium]|nr:RNA methyltransferase [Bacteroidales bacterium]